MYNSECVNEFIDWLSTEISGPCGFSALQVANWYQDERSGLEEIEELQGGCTNSVARIKFYDGVQIKLSVYDSCNSIYGSSYYKDKFIQERSVKNYLYKDEFKIIYNADPFIVVSEYIDGKSYKDLISDAISKNNMIEIYNLNLQVAKAISRFHNLNSIKTHRSSSVRLAMNFFSSLKEELALDENPKFDSRNSELKDTISSGIEKILLFESKFHDSDFVLSHLDTDPVNILSINNGNESMLIDFEFAGVGLKYYDYVNYLNALNYLYFNDLIPDNIKENFINDCREVILNFNLEDFWKSYYIMRFIWGIWYILYGLKNKLSDYIEIGEKWLFDWANEEDVL